MVVCISCWMHPACFFFLLFVCFFYIAFGLVDFFGACSLVLAVVRCAG